MSAAKKGTFDAVARAAMGLVKHYRDAPQLPAYLLEFIEAVGGLAELALMGRQSLEDSKDADLWRFLLRSIGEGSAENRIMQGLGDKFENAPAEMSQADAFAAHVVEGLALFKAGA